MEENKKESCLLPAPVSLVLGPLQGVRKKENDTLHQRPPPPLPHPTLKQRNLPILDPPWDPFTLSVSTHSGRCLNQPFMPFSSPCFILFLKKKLLLLFYSSPCFRQQMFQLPVLLLYETITLMRIWNAICPFDKGHHWILWAGNDIPSSEEM